MATVPDGAGQNSHTAALADHSKHHQLAAPEPSLVSRIPIRRRFKSAYRSMAQIGTNAEKKYATPLKPDTSKARL